MGMGGWGVTWDAVHKSFGMKVPHAGNKLPINVLLSLIIYLKKITSHLSNRLGARDVTLSRVFLS